MHGLLFHEPLIVEGILIRCIFTLERILSPQFESTLMMAVLVVAMK